MKTRWWNSFVISGGDYTADTLFALCYIWFLSGLVYAQTIPMPKNEQLDRKQHKADLFTSTPTQNNTPVDRMYFDEVWKIRLHPSVSIPVPRAPFPTFGMLLPLPKSWFCTKHFFPVVADAMRVKIFGATNYIVESAARRFEALVRSRTGLSSYSVKWSHQQSQLPELARLYLSHSIPADHFAGTAGADPNLATTPTGSWPAKAVELLWQRFAVYSKPGQPNGLQTVSILVRSPGLSWPSLEMDESYILTVTAQGILLYANETWGALHGLTSLAQLLWKVTNTSQVYVNQTFIQDAPRFAHRGVMVDTSRHFISKSILLVNMETMAFHKMNVFHWHMVDDQSYPYQSLKFRNLSEKGAYHSKQTYSPQDIKEVVEFGRLRGIRVIPEFDIPGHTRSLAYAKPEVLAQCLSEEENHITHFGPLNPLKNETYTFLSDLLSELFGLFKDEFVHLGGDEVENGCLSRDPDIDKNREEMNVRSFQAVHLYFWRNVQNLITRHSIENPEVERQIIVWEDALEYVAEAQKSVLLHVWKSDLSAALQQGFNVIFSTCWYLDLLWDVRKWPSYYLCDPFENPNNPPLLPMQQKKVLGGEACMWSEFQYDDTILQKIWPVASAVSERLWSPSFVNNVETFSPRVEEMRCRLIERGVPVAVLNGPGSCPSSGVLSTFVHPADAGISPQDVANKVPDKLYLPLKSPWSAFSENKSVSANNLSTWSCLFYYVLGMLTGVVITCFLASCIKSSMMGSLGFSRSKVGLNRTGWLLLFVFLLGCLVLNRMFG